VNRKPSVLRDPRCKARKEYLANLSLMPCLNPLKRGWLSRFLVSSSVDDRPLREGVQCGQGRTEKAFPYVADFGEVRERFISYAGHLRPPMAREPSSIVPARNGLRLRLVP
jgi:hypothetical protein